MNLNKVKRITESLPYFVGKPVSLLPFHLRPGIGGLYLNRERQIREFSLKSLDEKKSFIFKKMQRIAIFAYENIEFYNEFYKESAFNPKDMVGFEDLDDIPIINKELLQSSSLERRSSKLNGRNLVNTGGSSGQPLDFYIQGDSVAHEWAHLHDSWRQLDFKQSDLKIMFVGRSSVRNIVDYDAGRHSLVVDIYKDFSEISDRLKVAFARKNPKFIHGYPSAIFDFMEWVANNDKVLFECFRAKIKGIILSSEYPSFEKRKYIEELYGIKTLSFYGHTERCVLAPENSSYFEFFPYQTYGYAEGVSMGDGVHLVGTSYYNFISPLIRYDTGDLIDPDFDGNILNSFRISSGRNGEVIYDFSGKKIYLTALIFGRHHKIFERAAHVQICQPNKCERASIVITLRSGQLAEAELPEYFDLDNVNLSFDVRVGDSPVRTPSGKVPLLVKCFNETEYELVGTINYSIIK